jgi:hypothetical protein
MGGIPQGFFAVEWVKRFQKRFMERQWVEYLEG